MHSFRLASGARAIVFLGLLGCGDSEQATGSSNAGPSGGDTSSANASSATGASTTGSGAGGSTGTEAAADVGPDGGVVATADGSVSIEIPPGALSQTVRITIDGLDGVFPGQSFGGVEIGPSGTTFALPATVRFTYDPVILGGRSAHGLRIATAIGDRPAVLVRDAASEAPNTIAAKTTHLSPFVLVGRWTPQFLFTTKVIRQGDRGMLGMRADCASAADDASERGFDVTDGSTSVRARVCEPQDLVESDPYPQPPSSVGWTSGGPDNGAIFDAWYGSSGCTLTTYDADNYLLDSIPWRSASPDDIGPALGPDGAHIARCSSSLPIACCSFAE